MAGSPSLRIGACWLAIVLGVAGVGLAADAPSKSEGRAKDLAKALDAQKSGAGQAIYMAAKDPQAPDQFVAVLYFPGMQMLLVAAKYSVPQLLDERLAGKDFQNVYFDLNSASVPKSKFFVEDMNADGLHATHDENKAFDSVDGPEGKMVFDGDWKKKKISEDDYLKAFASADASYARWLNVLLDSIKKGS